MGGEAEQIPGGDLPMSWFRPHNNSSQLPSVQPAEEPPTARTLDYESEGYGPIPDEDGGDKEVPQPDPLHSGDDVGHDWRPSTVESLRRAGAGSDSGPSSGDGRNRWRYVIGAGTVLGAVGLVAWTLGSSHGGSPDARQSPPPAAVSGAIPGATDYASPSPQPTRAPLELLPVSVVQRPDSTASPSPLLTFYDPESPCDNHIWNVVTDMLGSPNYPQPIACNPAPNGAELYEQSWSADGGELTIRFIDNSVAEQQDHVVRTPTSISIQGSTPDYRQLVEVYGTIFGDGTEFDLPGGETYSQADVSDAAVNPPRGVTTLRTLQFRGVVSGVPQTTVVYGGGRMTAEISTTLPGLNFQDPNTGAFAIAWLLSIAPELATANQ